MSAQSLEGLLEKVGNPVTLVRNSQIGPYVYPKVPSEFSNWRDEQHAWRDTCCLFDQSHHMTDLTIKGPDALKLLSAYGVNSFENFQVNKAKQFVACTPDGYVIGDAILFYLDTDVLSLVGRPSAHNWVQYHGETGDYDVTFERDERSAVNPTGRRLYRFQVQGPNALKVLEKTSGPLPEIKFFNMGEITIAGHNVRALHHGMSGVPGLELFGPWAEGDDVRAAIVEAGRGVRARAGRLARLRHEHARVRLDPVPAAGDLHRRRPEGVPRVAAGRRLRGDRLARRQHVLGRHLRLLPDALGPRLRRVRQVRPRLRRTRGAGEDGGAGPRKKVTLAWNGEDVAAAMGTMFQKDNRAKYIDLPLSNYSTWPNDKVLKDGKQVGVSTFSGYSSNESSMLSLAIVDLEQSEPGTEVTLVWGEEGGGSAKPVVERHVQTEIRAIVSPAPYAEVVRASYRPK